MAQNMRETLVAQGWSPVNIIRLDGTCGNRQGWKDVVGIDDAENRHKLLPAKKREGNVLSAALLCLSEGGSSEFMAWWVYFVGEEIRPDVSVGTGVSWSTDGKVVLDNKWVAAWVRES